MATRIAVFLLLCGLAASAQCIPTLNPLNGIWDCISPASGAGSGDVVGPASSVSGNVATFNGTGGKTIQDGGKALPSGAIVGTTDTQTLTNKTHTLPIFTPYTVGGLPGSPTTGQLAVVTDAATAGSCTSGGGSAKSFCRYSGSAWESIGDGGSSASATFSAAATSGTLTHNLGSAVHVTWCHDGTTGLPVIASYTRGTNADAFTFTGGLANDTVCIATTGGAGGGASSAISTLYALGSSGASKTVDPANGWAQTMTLSANCTVTLTQPSAGSHATVRIGVTQASSGGPYTVAFTGAKWPGGIAPVMTATASAVDWYSCLLDGTNSYCTAGQNFQ